MLKMATVERASLPTAVGSGAEEAMNQCALTHVNPQYSLSRSFELNDTLQATRYWKRKFLNGREAFKMTS